MNPLKNILHGSGNLYEVEKRILHYLKSVNKKGERVGFVSGIIFSGGIERFGENVKKLDHYTKKIRKKYSFLIFSAVDVFYSGLFNTLSESREPFEVRRPKMMRFWNHVMTSGYITDLFIEPGWELSEGARMEHERCKEMNVTIHYPE